MFPPGKSDVFVLKEPKNADLLQDIILKMSKKIAQILLESASKLQEYEKKIMEVEKNQQSINELQNIINKNEQEKQEICDKYQELKVTSVERETSIKNQYKENLSEMYLEVEQVKQSFATKVKLIEDTEIQFREEKSNEIETLKAEYEEEILNLKNDIARKNDQIVEHVKEIEKLNAVCVDLNLEIDNIHANYKIQLDTAQLFYDKELQLLQHQQGTSFEEKVKALSNEKEKLC